MGLSIWQIALIVILLILLFGRGKLSGLMSDLAEGIQSFRHSMKEGAERSKEQAALTSPDEPAGNAAKSASPATGAAD